MKKVLSFLVLFIAVAMIATTVSAATTTDDLLAKAKELASKYNVPAAYYEASLTRYVENNANLTEAQLQETITKAENTAALLDAAGVTDYKEISKLPAEKKTEISNSATAAAATIDLKLNISSAAGKENVTLVTPTGESIVNVQVNPETGKITKI